MNQLKHLAIILDGNRRWAKENGLAGLEGHKKGYDNVEKIGLDAFNKGVKYLTVFAFSTENWKRSKKEVTYLMNLLFNALTIDLKFYLKHEIIVKVIGRVGGLSKKLQDAIVDAEEKTKNGKKGQLNLCINYGGRAEIIDAVKELVLNNVPLEDVDEKKISELLWTSGIPDPDLIVRTSGEHRLSGFLTWQGVYSEIKFINKYWPDFSPQDVDDCISDFAERKRRFGS